MPNFGNGWVIRIAAAAALAASVVSTPDAQQKSDPAAAAPEPAYRAVVNTYCLSCHNSKSKAGGLELDTINAQPPGDHAEAWEKVVRKLRARQMSPVGARRPDERPTRLRWQRSKRRSIAWPPPHRIRAGPTRFDG